MLITDIQWIWYIIAQQRHHNILPIKYIRYENILKPGKSSATAIKKRNCNWVTLKKRTWQLSLSNDINHCEMESLQALYEKKWTSKKNVKGRLCQESFIRSVIGRAALFDVKIIYDILPNWCSTTIATEP